MIRLPKTLERLFRFGLVGLVVFSVALGLTAFQHEVLGFSEELAFGITLVVVLVIGFLANRHLVFDAAEGDIRRQGAHYAVASLVFRALQYLSFLALHTWLGMAYPWAVTIVLWSWFFIKFFYYRARIFNEVESQKSKVESQKSPPARDGQRSRGAEEREGGLPNSAARLPRRG